MKTCGSGANDLDSGQGQPIKFLAREDSESVVA
jgi:hypothetical protein